MRSCQIISNARYYLNHVHLWLNLKVEKSIYNSTQYGQFIKTLFSFSSVQETFKTFKTNIDATFDVSSINTPLSNGTFELWIVITWFCECKRFQRFFFPCIWKHLPAWKISLSFEGSFHWSHANLSPFE